MSLEQYDDLTSSLEKKLDESDLVAQESSVRYNKDELFKRVRSRIDD